MGKSSLMNFLSSPDEQVKGRFPISDAADPCTKGILMYIYEKNVDEAVLFLDCEVIILSFKARVKYCNSFFTIGP